MTRPFFPRLAIAIVLSWTAFCLFATAYESLTPLGG
jgi:hypothetical protein